MHTTNSVGRCCRTAAAAATLLCSGVAMAQGAGNADPLVDKLLQYGTEASVYKAMSKKLEAQLQALSKQAEIDKLAPAERRETGPALVAVEGINGKLTAVIELVPGAAIEANVGDVLPDGQRVESINFDSVVLRGTRGKRQTVLSVPKSSYGSTVGGFEQTAGTAKAGHE